MCLYLSLGLNTGVSMQCPRMLSMPVVLFFAYPTVQEEVLTRAGLTAENGIPVEVWLFCVVVDISAFF